LPDFPTAKINISNYIFNLSLFAEVPIFKTIDIKAGELRLFKVQGLKIQLRYKIIYNFQRIRQICSEKQTIKI
jgi:hypothetical protein